MGPNEGRAGIVLSRANPASWLRERTCIYCWITTAYAGHCSRSPTTYIPHDIYHISGKSANQDRLSIYLIPRTTQIESVNSMAVADASRMRYRCIRQDGYVVAYGFHVNIWNWNTVRKVGRV